MPKRMLIDAAHPEETRVVVTSGTRLEEFDFESSTKKQVKGNIYLAKVTRVEPSLQAAFVDYGGNRHGFLAFSEIHPDYYRIPVSDRPHDEADPAAEDDGAPAANTAEDGESAGSALAAALPEPVAVPHSADDDGAGDHADQGPGPAEPQRDSGEAGASHADDTAPGSADLPFGEASLVDPSPSGGGWLTAQSDFPSDAADAASLRQEASPVGLASLEQPLETSEEPDREPAAIALRVTEETLVATGTDAFAEQRDELNGAEADRYRSDDDSEPSETDARQRAGEASNDSDSVEFLGGDEVEEVEEADAERRRTQPMRHYKIQEVIKRRQIMLVQVAKEERGNKGAALTTYLSLAGRYCVLMPNTNRGGGVSRKITSIADRRRLKEIVEELEIPEGMGVIVRTAGAERSKAEIRRDYEYLLRLWNEIRDLTLQSTAPALIYEEGNLIKRSIRDLYTRDIDEVLVEGEEGYKTAKAFMRTLMPSHAKRVQPYRDPQIGLFHRFQIESQIDAIHSPVAQLRSGGYVVINQTEALVAIDVNSGRSTRERNIEETATRTNLEAAEEIARQLRLRDLAGLIVIDFIDMEEHRNQIAVERRLKDALKNDRARIQVGRISPFGLLEMSRQRLRPSLAEASTQPCPHCGGTGFIRSVESTALYVLRSIEEEGIRRRSAEICIYVPTTVALYILNQKRESLNQIEARYALRVLVARDDSLIPPAFRLERLRPYGAGEAPPLRPIQAPTLAEDEDEDEKTEAETEAVVGAEETTQEQAGDDERNRRRRRRRRRRGDEAREARPAAAAAADAEAGDTDQSPAAVRDDEAGAAPNAEREAESEAERRRRRRGRRGGRTRAPRRDEQLAGGQRENGQRENGQRENGQREGGHQEGGHHEGGQAEPAAAETVEVVAAPPEFGSAGESEAFEPLETWPVDAGVEAASLAPFAGDPAVPDEPVRRPYAAEPAAQAEAVPIAEAEQGIPFVSATERALEMAHPETVATDTERQETPPPDPDPVPLAAAAEASEGVRHGDAAEPYSMPAEPEHAQLMHLEPVHAEAIRMEPADGAREAIAPEAHAEPEPPQPVDAPARSAEEVLTVTEKPANPRRGWWQRLTQS